MKDTTTVVILNLINGFVACVFLVGGAWLLHNGHSVAGGFVIGAAILGMLMKHTITNRPMEPSK